MRCFSNDNDVSLRARLCNVDELVLSGPFYADVNAQTVMHTFQNWVFYHRVFGLFGGAIGLPRLARSLLTLIGSWRIYYVFKIKARIPFNILFLKFQFALKKVESSTTPLLTIDEVEKVQRQKIASFIGHVFQLTNAVLIDKLIQQEKVNHCNGLKTLYFNFVWLLQNCFLLLYLEEMKNY